jgi:uncharacterized integral membrane protein
MQAKTVFYILAALIVGVLVVANWSLFTTQVELNLLFVRMQAPLAILLLLLAAVILLLDAGVHMVSRHAWMRERRALKSDLEAALLRADREEESRMGTLRVAMERELSVIHAQLDRLMEGQSALLRGTSNETLPARQSSEVRRQFEPDLVSPRSGSNGRGS